MSALSGILYAPDPLSRDRWIALDAPLDERALKRIGTARREFEAEERRRAAAPAADSRERTPGRAAAPIQEEPRAQQAAGSKSGAKSNPGVGRLLVPLAGGLQVLTLGAAAETGEASFAARAAQLGTEAYRKAGAEPALSRSGHMGLVSFSV